MTAATDVVPSPASMDAVHLVAQRTTLQALEQPRWRQGDKTDALTKLETAWRWLLDHPDFKLYNPDGEQMDVTGAVTLLEEHSRRVERDGAGRLPHSTGITRIVLGDRPPAWYVPVDPYVLDLIYHAADRFHSALVEVETRYAQSLANNTGEITRLRENIARLETAPTPQ